MMLGTLPGRGVRGAETLDRVPSGSCPSVTAKEQAQRESTKDSAARRGIFVLKLIVVDCFFIPFIPDVKI
jgi:hypothetical protein